MMRSLNGVIDAIIETATTKHLHKKSKFKRKTYKSVYLYIYIHIVLEKPMSKGRRTGPLCLIYPNITVSLYVALRLNVINY